jgi:hypothetical protein
MARNKKPENETYDESLIRQSKENISNHATRNEKVAFNRRMDNMVSLLATLTPIEEQIGDLLTQKQPIIESIQSLRNEMVRDCVHPQTHLVHHEEYVVCKFCDRKFIVME